MYKNIVPGLISIDTNLKKLNGFYLSDNFDFYPSLDKKNLFHYTVGVDNKLEIPIGYEFRDGYFLKNKDIFYNHPPGIKLRFNRSKNEFIFNRMCSFIPFEIGRIFPAGRNIADLIELELFLSGYIIFRGSTCFLYNNDSVAIMSPSFNGKSSFLKKMLIDDKIQYISEDILILDVKSQVIYPTAPKEFSVSGSFKSGRKNIVLSDLLNTCNIINNPINLDNLLIVVNSTVDKSVSEKNLFDAFFLKSMSFFENSFVKSYIFENNLSGYIYQQICNIKNDLTIKCKFINVKNFDFESILNNLKNK
ncbi:MAG: hypothetical protein WC564_03125 [Patescibacteria group bacterium]|jgi:hypothetical protein